MLQQKHEDSKVSLSLKYNVHLISEDIKCNKV